MSMLEDRLSDAESGEGSEADGSLKGRRFRRESESERRKKRTHGTERETSGAGCAKEDPESDGEPNSNPYPKDGEESAGPSEDPSLLLRRMRKAERPDMGGDDPIDFGGEPDGAASVPYAGMTEEDAEELKRLDELASEESRIRDEKRRLRNQRIGQALMSIACVYMIVLIFGAVITEFRYGDDGVIEPAVLSVGQIEDREAYTEFASLYIQARTLYEDILLLDYRIAAGTEDVMAVAPGYEEALDSVSTLATGIEGSDLETKYNQVASMLLEWVQTHLAAYCQYMSAAITENDESAANEAIAARTYVYTDFQLITENMINLGEEVVYDLTDIRSWSPEGYVSEATGDVVS